MIAGDPSKTRPRQSADFRQCGKHLEQPKARLGNKASQEGNYLPANVEKIGKGQWLKVTPAKELGPGEYALVEMLGPQEMNLYVWDFGVNPQASGNPNVWRPAAAQSKKPGN